MSNVTVNEYGVEALPSPIDAVDMDDESLSDDDGGGRGKVAVAGAILSNIFLFFLIYGLSATVETKSLTRHFLHNKKAILTGMGVQFIIMPLSGYLAVLTAIPHGLTEAMGITLLVLTASPGGSYSNWWCSLFNADLALSVAMTTCSSIMAVAMLPFNLFVYTHLAYGKKENKGESIIETLDFETMFISLSVVLSAILLGLYTGYRCDGQLAHERANRLGSICGLLLVITSVFMSNGGDDSSSRLWNQPGTFYMAVAAPCLAGLLISTLLARTVVRLSKPESVTIAIECCYQNTGIATSVAITMFANADERAQAVAVPLFYGFVEAVVCGLYCVYMWKMGWTKAPPNEKLCTVISKSYEVRHDDELAADHNDKDKKKQENHLAEEVDINMVKDDDDNDIDLEDVEFAASSSPLHVPPEQAALQQQQQQRHHAGFFSTVFGRKVPRQSDASEKALQQRKRIVSDFTAETMLTAEFQAQDSLNSNTTNNNGGGGGVPVQTIVEGGCESSEHVESDELVRDDDDEEEESHQDNNDTAKTSEKPDQTESLA